jgi:hypothetical protein
VHHFDAKAGVFAPILRKKKLQQPYMSETKGMENSCHLDCWIGKS